MAGRCRHRRRRRRPSRPISSLPPGWSYYRRGKTLNKPKSFGVNETCFYGTVIERNRVYAVETVGANKLLPSSDSE